MNIRIAWFVWIPCFLPILLFSQKDTLRPDSYIHFYYDNDFFSSTDRQYSQGIYIELITPVIKKSPVSKVLIPLKNGVHYYGIRIEQDIFTPSNIGYDSIIAGERPYSGVLLLEHNLISINTMNKQRLNTSLDLGIIGPAAKAEEEQRAVHKMINNGLPLGWKYQIANDFVVNYNVKF